MSSVFGGGSSKPKPPPAPTPPPKQEEVRKVVKSADADERDARQRRIPPGRSSTLFAGIEKALKSRLGQ